jgi:uncharacterized membrane protein
MDGNRATGKAWLIGAGIIVVVVLGDIVMRRAGFGSSEWLLYLVWSLFMAAVYLSTYYAPRYKLIVGMSHTLTISVLFAVSNQIQSWLGMGVDMSEEKGFTVVIALIYVTSFIPALIASVAGLLFSKQQDPHRN